MTKMLTGIIGLFLVGLTSVQTYNVTFDKTSLKIPLESQYSIDFTVEFPSENNEKPDLSLEISDDKIIGVSIESLVVATVQKDLWNGTLVARGLFLGRAGVKIKYHVDKDIVESELMVIVIRPQRFIDKFFTISVIILVSIMYINFACAMDWGVCKETLKRPIGPLIGSFCQFLIMPLLAFGIGQVLFPDRPDMQIGIFFTGISPSGGASNIWTVLLGGNLSLSITMTTLSTLASFITIPIWSFSLGKYIFDKGNMGVPYSRMGEMAFVLVFCLAIGFLIQKKFPRLCRIMVRIMKPLSVILILFIVIFAIVTNIYLFELFSWKIALAGMGLPWLGFMFGLLIMLVFRRPHEDVRAIAIETGIQNTGIAIFLLRISMGQPEADLTTVIPVACAIMTPIPLTVLWLLKIIFDRRKKDSAASTEKLQGDNMPVVISNLSTITA